MGIETGARGAICGVDAEGTRGGGKSVIGRFEAGAGGRGGGAVVKGIFEGD